MPVTPKIAVVEIGTNSVKLLIARGHDTRPFKVDHFSRKTTRFGGRMGVTGRPAASALDVNVEALRSFKHTIHFFDCSHVFAFGTYAFRVLARTRNATAVMRRLEKALGVPIRVLTGREEACLAYLSAKENLPLVRRRTVLIDVGGGSTELVVADSGRVRHARSLPLGALHLTERFIHSDPIEKSEFDALTRHVDRVWRGAMAATGLCGRSPGTIVLAASGGTIGSLAQGIAGRERFPTRLPSGMPSPRITSAEINAFLDRCLELKLRERKRIRGLEPERADIICAGLAIVLSMMRSMGKRVLYPNRGGVREGALIHLIQNGLRW